MWHCLRLVRVEGPSLAELADPGLGSGSRLYCATDVGLAACDDSPLKPMLAAAQQYIEGQPGLFLAVGVVMCAGVMRHLQKDRGR